MKKNILFLLALGILFYPTSSKALFPLPPFKIDAGVIGNEASSSINAVAGKAEKTIQQSSLLKWIKKTGQGAKEQFEFNKMILDRLKGLDWTEPSSAITEMADIEAERGKTKLEAAEEINNKSQEVNKKISEINANIIELNRKIIEESKNSEGYQADFKKIQKYQKKIQKYEKEKDKLSKKLVKDVEKINERTESKFGKLNETLDNLKESVGNAGNELLSAFKSVPADYDSTEDLRQKTTALIPTAGKEISLPTAAASKTLHTQKYYDTLMKTPSELMKNKINIINDNKKASQTEIAVDNFETSGGAIGGVLSLKIQNIQGTLNYTELLLKQIQLEVSRDLLSMKVEKIDPVQVSGDFNLDNYKFSMPSQAELEELENKTKKEKLKKLDEKITPSSGAIISDAYENMKISEKTEDEKKTSDLQKKEKADKEKATTAERSKEDDKK